VSLLLSSLINNGCVTSVNLYTLQLFNQSRCDLKATVMAEDRFSHTHYAASFSPRAGQFVCEFINTSGSTCHENVRCGHGQQTCDLTLVLSDILTACRSRTGIATSEGNRSRQMCELDQHEQQTRAPKPRETPE